MMLKVTLLLCLSIFGTQAIPKRAPGQRIIGGDQANAAQFPFAAAVYKQTSSGTYFCAGALINDQWVVTAGTCVQDAVIFTVRLGSNSLSANDPNALRLATDTYYLHPDFNQDNLDNDIGLIKFRIAITFTDYIRPVSVLSSATLPDSSSVATFGWGQTSDAEAGVVDLLNYVFLVTLSNEECRLAFGNQITENMVCVDGNYNEGICRGDLGSPLIQYGGSSLTYLVGVGTWISANGCESTDPSGFIRLAPYVAWINNITETA